MTNYGKEKAVSRCAAMVLYFKKQQAITSHDKQKYNW